MWFLVVLVIIGVVASGYVLNEGLKDASRSRFKLFLSCSHILTSVVPPEFPITMTLCVTLSLVQLVSHAVTCTEPDRVPFGGRVSTCLFDKTDTLTSESMDIEGVHGLG